MNINYELIIETNKYELIRETLVKYKILAVETNKYELIGKTWVKYKNLADEEE